MTGETLQRPGKTKDPYLQIHHHLTRYSVELFGFGHFGVDKYLEMEQKRA